MQPFHTPSCESRISRRLASNRQQGIVLIFALIVLVIMSVASLLMLRTVKSGLGIAGNIGFKQNATSGADLGIEAGRAWVVNVLNNKDVDSGQGYFATWNGGVTEMCVGLDGLSRACEFNPTTYDWTGSAAQSFNVTGAGDDGTGNRVRYVIHRLCQIAGSAATAGQSCVLVPGDLEKGSGGGGASESIDSTIRQPYFRVTTRVDGPRNTVSYVQVIMF